MSRHPEASGFQQARLNVVEFAFDLLKANG
jgi:hypothetical protein